MVEQLKRIYILKIHRIKAYEFRMIPKDPEILQTITSKEYTHLLVNKLREIGLKLLENSSMRIEWMSEIKNSLIFAQQRINVKYERDEQLANDEKFRDQKIELEKFIEEFQKILGTKLAA